MLSLFDHPSRCPIKVRPEATSVCHGQELNPPPLATHAPQFLAVRSGATRHRRSVVPAPHGWPWWQSRSRWVVNPMSSRGTRARSLVHSVRGSGDGRCPISFLSLDCGPGRALPADREEQAFPISEAERTAREEFPRSQRLVLLAAGLAGRGQGTFREARLKNAPSAVCSAPSGIAPWDDVTANRNHMGIIRWMPRTRIGAALQGCLASTPDRCFHPCGAECITARDGRLGATPGRRTTILGCFFPPTPHPRIG